MSKLKQYIEKRGLTQQELASMVGLNQATVSKHIRGKGMRLDTALKYSRALNIPVEDLLPDDKQDA